METGKDKLLPINQRVTHFDGGPNTHGKGTIVAYNGVKADSYGQSNLRSAAEIIGQADDSVKAALFDGLVNSFYDGTRCPYVVQWDPRPEGTDWHKKYPNGYKDVYEPDSIRPINEE